MNCENAKDALPDSLAGTLVESARVELDTHLRECAVCREEHKSAHGMWTRLSFMPERQPSPSLDRRFETMLEGYRAGLDREAEEKAARVGVADWVRHWFSLKPAWQFALVLLLFGGGVFAGWNVRRPAKPQPEPAQLTELRQEVRSLKEQMALALLDQKSAGERLLGVEWTSRLKQPDEQVLNALLRAVDSDPNVNVRLAAIEALQPFARQEPVKTALLASLPRQQSPLVQVELIHLLVDREEKESMPILKSLVEDGKTDESVREQARWGLSQLGV